MLCVHAFCFRLSCVKVLKITLPSKGRNLVVFSCICTMTIYYLWYMIQDRQCNDLTKITDGRHGLSMSLATALPPYRSRVQNYHLGYIPTQNQVFLDKIHCKPDYCLLKVKKIWDQIFRKNLLITIRRNRDCQRSLKQIHTHASQLKTVLLLALSGHFK